MNHLTLNQLDSSNEAKTRLYALMIAIDSEFDPPLSTLVGDLSSYASKLAERGKVIVAEVEDQDVGLAAVYVNDVSGKTAFIPIIGVHKEYQKHGIGRLLMQAVVSVALDNEMKSLRLEVAVANYSAIQLYSSFDFRFTLMQASRDHFGVMERCL